MRSILNIALLICLSSLSMHAQHQGSAKNHKATSSETAFPKAAPFKAYSSRVITAQENTFGYEILQDNRPMIRQITIPGQPGNKGFTSKADAEKVAALVIGKLRKGEMPPSVTIEEMKKLKVIK